MVDPTKVKPRRFRSLATASESSVRAGRSDMSPGPVHHRRSVHPGPQVAVEGSLLVPDGQERPGVGHRTLHLEPVAHDAGILQQRGQLLIAVAGDPAGVEAVEGASVVVPLVEDGRPGQAGLRPFEDEHLEQVGVIVRGDPPFMIVVPPIASELSAQSQRCPVPALATLTLG